jgi:hypothetical protein
VQLLKQDYGDEGRTGNLFAEETGRVTSEQACDRAQLEGELMQELNS